MRYVDRTQVAVPPSLAQPSAAVQAEKDAAAQFYRTYNTSVVPKPKAYDFVQYKDYDVTQALRTLFHGKCAYCETAVGNNLDVEHFRPKGGVHEDPQHPGYWWLAHTWENLLPSCMPCNQKRRQHIVTENMTVEELTTIQSKRPRESFGKANQFPVDGVRKLYNSLGVVEKNHLIDPTTDDPDDYLSWSHVGNYSIVLPKTNDAWLCSRADKTISVFALNRIYLVQSRTQLLDELRFQAAQILKDLEADMAAGGEPRLIHRAIERADEMKRHCSPQAPYSAMCKAFIDEFIEKILQRV